MIHWESCKRLKFHQTNKCYKNKQECVLEYETHKIHWNFEIQTDHLISARRPDLVLIIKKKKNLSSHIRGTFNKFPYFFVQAFNIVVDSWKFSMLLLYILWDDWQIFRISDSNQRLQ